MKEKDLHQNGLSCVDFLEWREWLTKFSQTEPEIWLRVKRAGSKKKGVSLAEAVNEAICFGWIDGRLRSVDQDYFILHFSHRRPGSVWSKINRNRAEQLIKEGRMTDEGMRTVEKARATGSWELAYSSKERPTVPPDLTEALGDDPEANENFQHWPNSAVLSVCFWIEQAKRPETRKTRIQKTVNMAKNDQRPE